MTEQSIVPLFPSQSTGTLLSTVSQLLVLEPQDLRVLIDGNVPVPSAALQLDGDRIHFLRDPLVRDTGEADEEPRHARKRVEDAGVARVSQSAIASW